MKDINSIKGFRKTLKKEIVSLMEKGHILSKHIKFLKWNGPEAYETYHKYRVNVKPETDEQHELGVAAAAIFRPIRKSCLRPSTFKKRMSAWEKKKTFGVKARHLQLLYGMLCGKSYNEMEGKANTKPSMDVMVQIILKYYFDGIIGENNLIVLVKEWLLNGDKKFSFNQEKVVTTLDLNVIYCNIPNLGGQLLADASIIQSIDIIL
jgi:hypothetical protein